MSQKPHDALVKAAFGPPKHAAELFRHVLPPDVVAALDWPTIQAEPGELIDDKLVDSHTDLLFSVAPRPRSPSPPAPRRRVFLYLHCEHMSSSAPDVPLRMLEYETGVWRRFLAANPGAPLPPILPVLLAQVAGRWAAPASLDDMLDPLALRADITPHLPRFAPIVIDLGHLTDDEIHAMSLDAFPKAALWFLRDARDFAQLMASLDHWWGSFCDARAAPDGASAFRQLVRYAASVLPRQPFLAFHGKIAPKLTAAEENTMLSYADHLRQEGRDENARETRDRLAGVLRNLLVAKFTTLSPENDRRIADAPIELLYRYIERTATADSVTTVFAE